jgi:F0F1-type ATP synthase assembly protein I
LPPRAKPPETENPKGDRARGWTSALGDAAPLLGLGTTLAVTVLAGLGLGYWADQRFGTKPWLLLLGACLGIAAALVHFFSTVAGSSKGPDRKP